MKLLFDIGNTRTKWALADGSSVVVRGDSLDWPAMSAHKRDIDSIWVSCVGQVERLNELSQTVRQLFGLNLNKIEVAAQAGGLRNGYQDLERLGVDRWVAAIGAHKLYPESAIIVVDVGTAITLDYIDANQTYQGGVIMPGFALMHDSLVGNTAGISSERSDVSDVVGKTTQECVNAGALYGVLGGIERVIRELQLTSSDHAPRLLITGGDAEMVTRLSSLAFAFEPNLIFDGLLVVSGLTD